MSRTPALASATASTPELSVLIPTYGRGDTLRRLLDRLAAQTLAPSRFEVVVVDDGSPQPVLLATARYPMRVTVLRQANAGPGAARNFGAKHCRAAWTLILNDDAVPADDLLERHLQRARELPPRTALLGTFDFTPEAVRSPFTQLLQHSDLLFDFPNLHDGQLHAWSFFWTCNLGLPTADLRANSFDAERFKEAIVEDVELGYRLAKQGWQVLFDSSLRCLHDHVQEPGKYFRRMVRLGVNMARMAHKHDDPGLLQHHAEADERDQYRGVVQRHVEAFHGTARKVLAALESLERESFGQVIAAAEIARLQKLVRQMGTIHYFRGILLEQEGVDPFEVIERGPSAGRLTSIVVLSHNQLDRTRRCLQALRDAYDPRHPVELLFVDNGSTDGSAEWLAAQPDVMLLANDHNAGAPAARNQALAVARGEYLVVMDNDAFVSPGWLHRLLHHAEVDGRVGCIGPVSDRAAHRQQIDYQAGADPEAQRRFADALYEAAPGAAEPRNVLSSFCLLFPRAVLDAIGGFDPRFSPWGYEDDDFTLRAAMAGFRNRIASDVFVRHESYGGEKADRHAELLFANWRRFAEKWGGDPEVPRGDNAGVESRMRARGRAPEIYVPLAPDARGRSSATVPPTASTPTRPTTLNHKNSTLSVQ